MTTEAIAKHYSPPLYHTIARFIRAEREFDEAERELSEAADDMNSEAKVNFKMSSALIVVDGKSYLIQPSPDDSHGPRLICMEITKEIQGNQA